MKLLFACLTFVCVSSAIASVRCNLTQLGQYSTIIDEAAGKALLKQGRHIVAELYLQDSEHADLRVSFIGTDVYGNHAQLSYDMSEDANDSGKYGKIRFSRKGRYTTKSLINCRQ